MNKKYITEAAFKAGSAMKVMEKILVVLSKRLRKKYTLSSLPWTYKNDSGQFAGFFAFDSSMSSALRINFLLGKSDKIVSVDYYEQVASRPTYTIDLNGLNIVDTVDTIAGVVDGTYFREDVLPTGRRLRERMSGGELVDLWLKSDPDRIYTRFESGRETWPDLYADFESFVTSQSERVPSMSTFKWNVKHLAEQANIQLNIIQASVRRGSAETGVVVDTASQTAMNSIVVENEHIKKFEMLESYTKMIGSHSKYLNSLLVYGQAGIGKTRMVKNVFKEMGLVSGQDYIVKTGSIAGKTGLRQMLWDYREGQIIVLDDNDGILKNMDAVNMLKAALQDEDRIISYTVARREGVEDTGEVLGEETVDLTDLDSDGGVEGGTIPDDFEFKSKMIFISNLMDFPAAIKSRCISIKIDMTVEQTLDLIRNSLDKVFSVYPEITIEMKEDVFQFVKENVDSLESMDFRQYQFALIPYLTIVEAGGDPRSDKSWQDWALIGLKS